MSGRPELKLDWCSHAAAKYAVEHWHYSRSMPMLPMVAIGVWEHGEFIGCVLFSRGANKNLATPYRLKEVQACELTRVALRRHSTPVSRILSISIAMLRQKEKGIRLIISFADPNERHHGGIYQAAGWLYAGLAKSTPKFMTRSGKVLHQRQVSKTGVKPQFGKPSRVPVSDQCEKLPQLDKHRYLMPLDADMRKQIEPLRKPYPKRAGSETETRPIIQSGEGGSTPTPALQTPEGVT